VLKTLFLAEEMAEKFAGKLTRAEKGVPIPQDFTLIRAVLLMMEKLQATHGRSSNVKVLMGRGEFLKKNPDVYGLVPRMIADDGSLKTRYLQARLNEAIDYLRDYINRFGSIPKPPKEKPAKAAKEGEDEAYVGDWIFARGGGLPYPLDEVLTATREVQKALGVAGADISDVEATPSSQAPSLASPDTKMRRILAELDRNKFYSSLPLIEALLAKSKVRSTKLTGEMRKWTIKDIEQWPRYQKGQTFIQYELNSDLGVLEYEQKLKGDNVLRQQVSAVVKIEQDAEGNVLKKEAYWLLNHQIKPKGKHLGTWQQELIPAGYLFGFEEYSETAAMLLIRKMELVLAEAKEKE